VALPAHGIDWENGGGKPLGQATTTKLVAWGSPYGWLGASSYENFDDSATLNGTGDRSYATFIVLGPRCRYQGAACTGDGDVAVTVRAVDALAQATLTTFTAGGLATSAPAGPGATQSKALVNGYNDTYAAYYVVPAGGKVAFKFTTPAAGAPVDRPIFVLTGVTPTKLPVITVGGSPVTVNTGAADSGAFVSYRSDASELWITLNRTLGAAVSIAIAP
jgi:hypothetical protein